MVNRLPREDTDRWALVLPKGDESYTFVYDRGCNRCRAQLLRKLGEYASNPELSFTWHDAAMLSQAVRAIKDRGQAMYEDWLRECVEDRGWSIQRCAETIHADPAEVAKDYERIKS